MKIITFYLSVMLLFAAQVLLAQNGDFQTVAGKVVDARSGRPLHYASINLVGTGISNVTNAEGFFTLKVGSEPSPEALLTVSYLGYATSTIKITDFSTGSDKPLTIRLQPVSLTLNPALIRAQDPAELLTAALYRIKDNYPDRHVGMTAFYRELIKKGNSKYLTMNEAVLDIDKAPYESFQADRVGIYKGRGSQNYDSSDTLFIRYQGGIMSILEIDQAKNPFATVTIREVPFYYDLTNEPSVYQDDRMFYVISFNQKPMMEDIYMRGKVFIDSESLAIAHVDMWMNVEGREDAVPIFLVKRPRNTRFMVESAAYSVNYKPVDGKWYYDYAKMEVKFESRRKYALFKNHYTIMSEIAVTDHKAAPAVIEKDARVRFRDQLTEKVSAFTDDNFWENYNVIEPDTDIEAIIRKIVRQLKKHNLE